MAAAGRITIITTRFCLKKALQIVTIVTMVILIVTMIAITMTAPITAKKMDRVKYKLVKQCHHPLMMKATIRLGIEIKIEQMLHPQVLNAVDQVLQVFDYAIHHKIAQEETTPMTEAQ